MFRSEDWDVEIQTLSANRSGTIFDVCERLAPSLACEQALHLGESREVTRE